MPVSPTYPGVYIQEIPSGVRTITGVATSIAAFVGRAARGPVNTPETITSYGDFERIFGGLWSLSRLGYAVRDFYQNGGTTAIIVRLVHSDAAKAAIALPGGPPTLTAADEGGWGNALHAVVDYNVSADVATSFGLNPSDLFNLTDMRTQLRVDQNFQRAKGSLNTDFGKPTGIGPSSVTGNTNPGYQRPFYARFGVRFEF